MTPTDNSDHDESCEVPMSISCRIGSDDSGRPVEETESEREAALIAALALRSYHLPGYSWCQDWFQYMVNNHPLIGICCHHRLHPIRTCMRIVALFGSFVFGLAITNMIFIWFVLHDESGSETVVSVSIGSNSTVIHGHVIYDDVTVTNGMIALWTVGGTLHALFDNAVWFIAACSCCFLHHPSKAATARLDYWRKYGNYFVILVVLLVTAICTFVVMLRATLDTHKVDASHVNSGGLVDDEVQLFDRNVRARSLQFLVSYSVEMALALFVYYPIVGTILFSGVLGCHTLPLLGGQPREVRLEQEHNLKWRPSAALGRSG